MSETENTIVNIDGNPILAALHVNSWYLALNLYVAEGGTLTPTVRTELLRQVLSETKDVYTELRNQNLKD